MADDGMRRKKKVAVVVVGGTGYLGQHLLEAGGRESPPSLQMDLAFTYNSPKPPRLLLDSFPGFHVDLRTGIGFDAVSNFLGQPDVVVNCAALSVPRACEANPDAAMSVNVPTSLLAWMSTFREKNTLLIHLSTDQVYEGSKSFYKEEDKTAPVNVYGKSKVAAEQFIAKNWSNFAILRSSIIYGPQTVSPVPKSLPIQWIDGVLSKGDAAEFFHDEFRCPVYVKDVVRVTQSLMTNWLSEGKQMQLLLNVGGPDRVSRVEMAEAVARVRRYSTSLIKKVSALSVDRGVKSPADISMDISKLIETLKFSPVPFEEGVKLTLLENQTRS